MRGASFSFPLRTQQVTTKTASSHAFMCHNKCRAQATSKHLSTDFKNVVAISSAENMSFMEDLLADTRIATGPSRVVSMPPNATMSTADPVGDSTCNPSTSKCKRHGRSRNKPARFAQNLVDAITRPRRNSSTSVFFSFALAAPFAATRSGIPA
jgi:hypothetical protein